MKKTVNSSSDSLYEKAYIQLRDAICSGRYEPKQRLYPDKIADELGMSRTPVREALRRLESTSYIQRLDSGSFMVTEHSYSRLRNLFEIRTALEGLAASLACTRYQDEQLPILEAINQRFIEAIGSGNIDDIVATNNSFHETLYKLAGNDDLFDIIYSYRDERFLARILHTYTDKNWRSAIKEHNDIIEALRERNAKKAGKIQKRHLEEVRDIAIERLW